MPQVVISGRVFDVPPHLVGIVDRNTSWGRGLEQQEVGFVRAVAESFEVNRDEALSLIAGMELVRKDED